MASEERGTSYCYLRCGPRVVGAFGSKGKGRLWLTKDSTASTIVGEERRH